MPEQRVNPRWPTVVGFAAVVGLAGAVYLRTLAPSITWAHHGADGGDLATAVATGGIPHPSGYPTYVLLGQLFALLPWGDLAYRLNLMSAVAAALTVGILYLIVLRSLRQFAGADHSPQRHLVAGAGALAFGFSPLFWSQALIVEVYTLHALFVAVVTYLVLRWLERPRGWLLAATALAMGAGLGNHLTLALMIPVLAVLVGPRRSDLPCTAGEIIAVMAPFLLGLSVYAALPLRASRYPPVNWGDPQTLRGFLWTVTGTPYRHYLFGLPLRFLPARLAAWAGLLVLQFGWWGLIPGLIGIWWLGQKARALALATLVLVLGTSIYAVGYDTADSHVYLIPAYLAFAVWLAWGLEWARTQLPGRVSGLTRTAVVSLLAVGLVVPSLLNHFRALDVTADREARDYGEQVMAVVAADAMVISSADRHTFTLWYYHYAKAQRPDLAVVDDALLGYDWYRRTLARVHGELAPCLEPLGLATENDPVPRDEAASLADLCLDRRPVYLTDPSDAMEARYKLTPEGPVYRVVGVR